MNQNRTPPLACQLIYIMRGDPAANLAETKPGLACHSILNLSLSHRDEVARKHFPGISITQGFQEPFVSTVRSHLRRITCLGEAPQHKLLRKDPKACERTQHTETKTGEDAKLPSCLVAKANQGKFRGFEGTRREFHTRKCPFGKISLLFTICGTEQGTAY